MWQFWIDVGGTFTDCVAVSPNGELRTAKTLSSGRVKGAIQSSRRKDKQIFIQDSARSTDVLNFWRGWTFTVLDESGQPLVAEKVAGSDEGWLTFDAGSTLKSVATVGRTYELSSDLEAPVLCVRQVLNLPLDAPLPSIEMRLGTTRGTNALLERKGARTAFVITAGFEDILHIGSQERPDLFALHIVKPVPLAEVSIGIEERVDAAGAVMRSPNAAQVRGQLQQLKESGIQAIAICLLHAYRNPEHEQLVELIAKDIGFQQVSRSSAVAPLIKLVSRAETTVLDAYLTPVLRNYLDRLQAQLGAGSRFKVMTSSGGLVDASQFSGRDSILSGPAGGVIGYARVAEAADMKPAIGFDMGGTSTDVSRYGGTFELETETRKAGVRIMTPTLSIETVAAGGGSICEFDGVQLRVGPESAGSDPGPASYGRGGPLTVTDLNLALGRLLPERFPFPLDLDVVHTKLKEMCEAIAQSPLGRTYTPESLAQGLIDIANETMVRAIRRISVQRGFDPAAHTLVCFGGAGGLHACALARQLKIRRILIHPFAGILSAYGMGLADVQRHEEFSVLRPLSEHTLKVLDQELQHIELKLQQEVLAEGISLQQMEPARRTLNVRYRGVEATLGVPWNSSEVSGLKAEYERLHSQFFGYVHSGRELEVVTARTEVTGQSSVPETAVPPMDQTRPGEETSASIWLNGKRTTARVLLRQELEYGFVISGPALIIEPTSTILVESDFQVHVRSSGELELRQRDAELIGTTSEPSATNTDNVDPVLLEVFNNQFASIAEQMGLTLQRTSVSTNVKERLDYSCAVFDSAGGLVVNAPHIPVHLGAMSETVRWILADNPEIHPGDVFVTNDPYRGGSHLPDVTVVTPVHDSLTGELLFLTASRAHHAEIGGIVPGSMPPFSRNLAEEGVLIRNLKLIDGESPGNEGFKRLEQLLQHGGIAAEAGTTLYPSRNVADNLADIRAQVAANQMGARLLLQLVKNPPGNVVTEQAQHVRDYMRYIQQAASLKMQRALERLLENRGGGDKTELWFVDHLDDGSPICVQITIERLPVSGPGGPSMRAVIDFAGTGPVLLTNLNANRAIVTAAVMYVFRCLIDESIPLNSGVMEPLEIRLPECLLNPPAHDNPAQCAAIVGGNVETSQRVVDVLLGALGVAAASQGTMNNLTFGNATFGYYETICGGSGATATGHGADAVHTHMTNTRLTDVEIIEHRYPVRIRRFGIRHGSGGKGLRRGGDGIVREFEFLEPLTVSLLTQRRGPYTPYGCAGGSSGACGRNSILRAGTDSWSELPGAERVDVLPGDCLRIETPGGGAWGSEQPS